jgi:tetratricopeptide (TPR) repeat protein
MTFRSIRFLRDRLTLRGWIALCLILAAAVGLPRFLSSRLMSQRRLASSLERARAHLAAREFDQGRRELRAALGFDPGNADARNQLATMELGLGNREIAFLEFQTLTEMQPQDPNGWIGIADLLVKGGLLAAPEAALDKAIAAAPTRADARLLRGEIRFRLGRYHGAHVDAQAAVAEAPKDVAARGLLGRSAAAGPAPVPSARVRAEAQSAGNRFVSVAREHWPGRLAQIRQALELEMRQQNWTAAQRIVDSARQAYPETAFVSFLAGIVELAQGHAGEAERYLSESLKSAPRSPVIATALAKAWSRKNGAAFAGEQLMGLAERDGGFAFARYLAAHAFVDARDPVAAEAALRRGLVLQPDSSVPYQHLADYYLEVDRGAEAMSVLHQALDRFPHDADLQVMSARASAQLGKSKDAVRIYEELLSQRPDLDVVEYKLAALLASEDENGASSRRLPQLLQHLQSDHPSDPLLLDALGWALYRAGDRTRGRASLEAAVTGAPDEPSPHYHLAAVYARENKAELARSELKAALDSNRPFPERFDAMRLLRGSSSGPTAQERDAPRRTAP